jgi:chemotaxis-related protein WspB
VLVLLFDLDGDRYALDVRQVVEVLPVVRIKRLPHPPRGVAGVFNYRGAPVPVIDLAALMLGRPSRTSLSTRLIIAHYPVEGGPARVVGMIAERATETLRRPDQDFVAPGVTVDEAPYLGRVATDHRGIVQLVEVSRLLPSSVRDGLFQQAADA